MKWQGVRQGLVFTVQIDAVRSAAPGKDPSDRRGAQRRPSIPPSRGRAAQRSSARGASRSSRGAAQSIDPTVQGGGPRSAVHRSHRPGGRAAQRSPSIQPSRSMDQAAQSVARALRSPRQAAQSTDPHFGARLVNALGLRGDLTQTRTARPLSTTQTSNTSTPSVDQGASSPECSPVSSPTRPSNASAPSVDQGTSNPQGSGTTSAGQTIVSPQR